MVESVLMNCFVLCGLKYVVDVGYIRYAGPRFRLVSSDVDSIG